MKFDTLFTENILHQVNNLTHFCKRMGPVFYPWTLYVMYNLLHIFCNYKYLVRPKHVHVTFNNCQNLVVIDSSFTDFYMSKSWLFMDMSWTACFSSQVICGMWLQSVVEEFLLPVYVASTYFSSVPTVHSNIIFSILFASLVPFSHINPNWSPSLSSIFFLMCLLSILTTVFAVHAMRITAVVTILCSSCVIISCRAICYGKHHQHGCYIKNFHRM